MTHSHRTGRHRHHAHGARSTFLLGLLVMAIVVGLCGLGLVGWVVALFFVAVFPGNISQYVNRIDAFGLNSDQARALRLLFQPVLVLWALWATGAWRAARRNRRRPRA